MGALSWFPPGYTISSCKFINKASSSGVVNGAGSKLSANDVHAVMTLDDPGMPRHGDDIDIDIDINNNYWLQVYQYQYTRVYQVYQVYQVYI